MKKMTYASTKYLLLFLTLFTIFFLQCPVNVLAQETFPIAKTVNTGSIDTGQVFQYTINYRCASTSGVCTLITVNDPLPPDVEYVSSIGTSDVANINYNSGTHTVEITFNDPVLDGRTGDITIDVRFRQGSTTNGTIASNQATANGPNIPPTPSTTVQTTAQARNQWELHKDLVSPPAPLDTDVTYRVWFEDDGNVGNLNLDSAVLVDILPVGVTFSSATGGGVYNPGPREVTWNMGNLSAGASQITYEQFVTVQFPSSTFNVGNLITNNVRGSGTPAGESPVTFPETPFDHNIGNPQPAHSISKTSSVGQAAIGNSADFLVSVSNTGNVPLDNFIVEDAIPSQLGVTQITTGKYNTAGPIQLTISYQTTANATWRIWPGGPFNGVNNTALPVSALSLAPNEYITRVRWDFSAQPVPTDLGASAASDRITVTGTILNPDYNGAQVNANDIVSNCATVDSSYGGNPLTQGTGCDYITVIDPAGLARALKGETTTGPYLPGNTITYRIWVENNGSATGNFVNPIMMDLLPEHLEYVPSSWTYNASGSGAPSPNFASTDNYNGTGRTLLRWSWTGTEAFSFPPGTRANVTFNARVRSGTPPGTITNSNYLTTNDGAMVCHSGSTTGTDTRDLDGDGDQTDTLCSVDRDSTIGAVAEMDSEKLVKGALDATWKKFPDVGETTLGGPVDYQITVTNTGNVDMRDLIIIDILPFIGDTGVQDLTPRSSLWSPLLAGPVSVPGVTVYYSTEGNPCRDEMRGTNPSPFPTGCIAPNWSAVPPADISTVMSLKFEFGTLVLKPLDSVVFNLNLIAPNNAPTNGDIAWNSFGFVAERTDSPGSYLQAEPNKVGTRANLPQPGILGNYVWADINSDGLQNESPGDGINGVTVRLYQPGPDAQPNTADDILVSSTSTINDSSGNPGYYLFSSLPGGDYFLKFYPPPNYAITTQDAGSDASDSDADPATGTTIVTSLGSAEDDRTWDIGLVQQNTASLGNYVWFDRNGNGIQDESALDGVNGVTVRLLQGGNPVASKVTADDINGNPGYYLFDGLTPGVNYSVEFVAPASATGFTTQYAGASNALDSDADATGRTGTVLLTVYQYNDTLDAGLIPQAGTLSLGNIIFSDTNNNGIYDTTTETGINGVRVSLYMDNNNNDIPEPGEFFAATTTSTHSGESGRYLFSNLPQGNYIVQADPSNFIGGGTLYGLASSTGNGTAPDPDNDADNDDNGDPMLNYGVVSLPVTLTNNTEPISEDGDNNTNLTLDFGFVPSASIGDYVWNDTNMNGQQDGGETGLANVTVNLFDPGPDGQPGGGDDILQATAVTAANGMYGFSGLTPGDYFVQFTLPTDYAFSPRDQVADTTDSDADTGTGQTIVTTLVSGQNDTSWDAGMYQQYASIGDFVWHDTNMNGIQDPGETGIQGVTVTLYDNAGNPGPTTTTNASGNYSFTSLAPGDYSVGFTAPGGYAFSPRDQGADTGDSDADTGTGRTATITLSPGQNDTSWDAGLYTQRASLGDFVWHDTNMNGVQDSGETGIQGVTVTLYDNAGNPGPTTTTNASGNYSFTSLAPGDYSVGFTAPGGYIFSPRDQGSDTGDSDADTGTGRTATITLSPGQNDTSWDAGFYTQRASIGDFVWNDANMNGVQDSGETGIPGVTVTLYDNAGNPGPTTTTNASGNYSFSNLAPGDYSLGFAVPGGYVFSPRDQGSDTGDSDADTGTGRTGTTTLTPGENDTSWDAGLYTQRASLGDTVWHDANMNGVQDSGETGIPGVTVTLYDNAGNPGPTTTTSASGNYSFANLAPGNYSVGFTTPGGYVFSPRDQGSDTGDSDADTGTGRTITTSLSPGENDISWDAGFYLQRASIGDLVWYDTNLNGIRNAGENGVSGVTVILYDNAGNQAGTTVTDSNGNYSFSNLAPGNYSLGFVAPSGYHFTYGNQGDDTTDSDADQGTGKTGLTTLSPGENDTAWDAGLYRPASIGDMVWNDLNGNGIRESGENGIPGLTVRLFNKYNSEIASTVTGTDGSYHFNNIVPGEYYLVFTTPAGYLFSPRDQGDNDTIDSDADPGNGRTSLTNLTHGENDVTWDAGMYLPAGIGDLVWHDLNGNGTRDNGENGIPGVTVRLFNNANTLISTTTTDSNGNYMFVNIPPGDYYIGFDNPAGYEFSPRDQGGDDSADSDANPGNARTDLTTLSPGENDITWDAGLYQPASIGDMVWNDLNGNGIMESGENGIPGVSVRLIDSSGNEIRTTTTDSNGAYLFENIPPGTYHVRFDAPEGYKFSPADQGGNDTLDSDADPGTGQTGSTLLSSGENDTTWDAGLYQPASIGDLVWNDSDYNGIKDESEAGINNVTVRLYRDADQDGIAEPGNDDGDPVAETSTGDDTNGNPGYYSFTGLEPGDYFAVFTSPSGYAFTQTDQGTDDAVDSDTDPATGQIPVTSLISGENDTSWDAGLYQPGSIGDLIWDDVNYNGTRDDGETGINGVQVSLYRDRDNDGVAEPGFNDGLPVSTTTTDNDASGNPGYYSFEDLPPGNYFVVFTTPPGYSPTLHDQGGDDTLDSDADPGTGQTPVISLSAGEDDTTWDAGFYQNASVGDMVWNDLNHDGIRDDNENGLNDVTVRLYRDADGDGIPEPGADDGEAYDTTVTADDAEGNPGNYSFEDLPPGNYFMVFTTPPDCKPTYQDTGEDNTTDSDIDPGTGQTSVISLNAGENDTTWDAGFYHTASLGNYVWNDGNLNGIQDDDENGVNGVAVVLYKDTDKDGIPEPDGEDGGYLRTTLTGNAAGAIPGYYKFTGLEPGDYFVVFHSPEDYSLTLQDQGGDNAADSDADPDTGQSDVISLSVGENDTTWDAGLYHSAGLGNYVWDDRDYDGIQDDDETGINGVRISLYRDTDGDGVAEPDGEDGPPVARDISTADDKDGNPGYYSFTGMAPGNYFMVFSEPQGYDFTRQNMGNHTTDSDTDPATGCTDVITLDIGEYDTTQDAGLYQTARLGNYAWYDSNYNGIQDDDETGMNDVSVTLYRDADKDGIPEPGTDDGPGIRTTVTSDPGNGKPGYYSFTGLTPDSYFVVFSTPAGYYLTKQDHGENDESDSDADPAGKTHIAKLVSGDNDKTLDAGFYQTGTIGNYVWNDADGDGNQDESEGGIKNVTVFTDLDGDGEYDRGEPSDVTDAYGAYKITGLPAGEYKVCVDSTTTPPGYLLTTDNVPMIVNLAPGQDFEDADFGYQQQATIGDYVWNDADGDGDQDQGETGIPNVTVFIDLNENGNHDPGEPSDITDANGAYHITGLGSGSYKVQADNSTVPADYSLTTGNVPMTVDLFAGQHYKDADFGYQQQNASIGDYVWLDADRNGIQDPGENGINGVTVKLYKDTDGDGIPEPGQDDGPASGTMTTGNDTAGNPGYYNFTDIGPGNYFLVFTSPEGYVFTQQYQGGDETRDSNAEPGTGQTSVVLLSDGENDITWDAGFYQTPASIGNYVWNDADRDGLQDDGEKGMNGVRVSLYKDADKDGIPEPGKDDGSALDSAITADDAGNNPGYYSFDDLEPGSYFLVFTSPDGYVFTQQYQGGDDTRDSNTEPGTGQTAVTVLSPGENDMTWDAGFYQDPASIGNYVWNDADRDGVQNDDENGMNGVTVSLYKDADKDGIPEPGKDDGSALDSAVTADDAGNNPGYYSFDDLEPGSYFLVFTSPEGYVFTRQYQGGDDTLDSNAEPGTGQTPVAALSAGESDITWDAGFYQTPASIGNYVWNDADRDGLRDDGENGMNGVRVSLYKDADGDGIPEPGKDDGSALDSTITADDAGTSPGYYSFDDLEPGSYFLVFTSPDGYVFTQQYQGGDDTLDSNAEPGTGQTAVTVLSAGENNMTWDAGFQRRNISISGTKSVTDVNGGNVEPGDELLFSVIMLNQSVFDASGVEFADTIPANTSYVPESISVSGSGTVQSETPEIRITGISVPARGQVIITFRVRVGNPLPADVNEIVNQGLTTYDSDGDGVNDTTRETDGDTVQPGEQPTTIPVTAGPNFSESVKSVALHTDADNNNIITPGDILGYTIMIPNTGNQDSTGIVILLDSISDYTSYADDSLAASKGTTTYNETEKRIEWTGNVSAGDSVTIRFQVRVNAGILEGTVISNQGILYYDSDGDGKNDAEEPTDSDTSEPGNQPTEAPVGGSPELVAVKNVSDENGGNLKPGDTLLYTIVGINKSGFDMPDTEFADSIPGHTTYIPGSLTVPAGSAVVSESPVIRITGIDLPAYGQLTVTFRVMLDDPLPTGVTEIVNQGTAYFPDGGSQQTDGDTTRPGNQPTVIPVAAGPNFGKTVKNVVLHADKDNNGVVSPGDTLRYTVTISNTGDQDADNVEFADNIPVNTSYVVGSADNKARYNEEKNRIEWTGHIGAGQNVTIGFDVTVNSGITVGTVISNQGEVSYDSDDDGENDTSHLTDSDTANPGYQPATVTVGGRPSAIAFKSVTDVNAGVVGAGDDLLYNIVIQNQTGYDVSGTEFVDNIPANTVYVPGSLVIPEDSVAESETPVLRVRDISIPAYSRAVISFRVRIADPLPMGVSQISNQGTAIYDSDGDGINDSSQQTDGDISQPGNQPAVIPVTVYGAIGNYVWYDADKNGVQDPGERGIAGVSVNVRGAITGEIIATTITNGSGFYEFTELVPGNYIVEFVLPSEDYEFSPSDMGTGQDQDLYDSDADTITGQTRVITLEPGEQNMLVDAGMFSATEPGSIGDFVWHDTDHDGIQDPDEPGVEGVAVNLVSPETGKVIAVSITGSSGYYEFAGLVPGDYLVEFELPAGYNFTSQDKGDDNDLDSDADPVTGRAFVSLDQGDKITNTDAGLYSAIMLGDLVWLDINGDGVPSPGEGIPGVSVSLYDSNGNVPDTVVTDSGGNYLFTGLLPGNYRVEVDTATLPDGAELFSDPDSVPDSATDFADQQADNLDADFGYRLSSASLGDYVWYDTNENGVREPGEPGIAGIRVNLADPGGRIIATTETDKSGFYKFTDLTPGDYTVGFVLPPGGNYVFSPGNRGTGPLQDAFDSDADETTGQTGVISLSTGEQNLLTDAGMFIPNTKPASIGNYVWYDENQDGIRDPDEQGIAGATVMLIDPVSDTVIGSATTDGSGFYKFAGLGPGDYILEFEVPAGYNFTLQNQGSNASDSDADSETGRTSVITLVPGEYNANTDAGMFIPDTPPGLIGDFVWHDADQDGIQDPGEPGKAGVKVSLYNSTGTFLVSETSTDPEGYYEFAGLGQGDYIVEFGLPQGYSFTRENQGDNEDSDSDADTGTGRTGIITVTPGHGVRNADAGLFMINPISLGDLVWLDANYNGVLDQGEGLAGVTVVLYKGNGIMAGTAVTDENGNYIFSDLRPGDYRVEVDISTLPHDAELFSDPDNISDSATDLADQSADNSDADFGYRLRYASIGDYVWLDINRNGIQEPGERGIADVTVNLTDQAGNIIAETGTDTFGFYEFRGLEPGDYAVEFVLPAGYEFTLQHQGENRAADSDADTATGRTGLISIHTGENDLSADAGMISNLAAIGDFVWHDANRNGIQDPGEPGMREVKVNLYNSTGTFISATATDVYGRYEFSGIEPGDYIVEFELPAGYDFALQDQGESDIWDSDADTVTGRTGVITLVSGENDVSADAGMTPQLAGIGDFVWSDTNQDGIQDPGEPGIGQVTVNLYDSTGTLLISTEVTDSEGYYEFSGIEPGDYIVEFELPGGYEFTLQDQGGNDASDSDADTGTGRTGIITLVRGENDLSADAGMTPQLAGLGDYVWLDANQNGIWEPGETGIGQVRANLYDSTGSVLISSVVTDPDGHYEFTELDPGDYMLEFVLPEGYDFTLQDQGGDDASDSDADTATGQTGVITLVANEYDLSADAGIFRVPVFAEIGDFVWHDKNQDGVQDPDEPGIADVSVSLYDKDSGTLFATTATDEDGFYEFTGLSAGGYTVEFELPEGYGFTLQDQGDDDFLDSDADPGTGQVLVSVAEGDIIRHADAGMHILPTISIGDLIWLDSDGNGLPSPGEGLSGVTVVLYDGDENELATAVTDENGNYLFSGLARGDYRVEADITTLPTGAELISDPDDLPDSATDLTDQSADNLDADFGYQIPFPDLIPDMGSTGKSVSDINGGDPEPGDVLWYTVTLFNSGTGPATGVVYSDDLHDHTSLVNGSVFTTQGTVQNGNNQGDASILADIGDISPGQSVIVTYYAVLDPDIPECSLIGNQGLVTGTNFSDEPTDFLLTPALNDPTMISRGTADVMPDADIDAVMTASDMNGGSLEHGDIVEYQVSISNNGPDRATNLVFTDSVPIYTSLVLGTLTAGCRKRTGECEVQEPEFLVPDTQFSVPVGSLEPGEKVNISFQVVINETAPLNAMIFNQGTINGDCGIQAVTHDASATGPTRLTLTGTPSCAELYKTVTDNNGGSVNPGDILEYTVTMTNTGETDATGILFHDRPGGHISLVPGTVSNTHGTIVRGNGEQDTDVEIETGTLGPGESATVIFQAVVSDDAPHGIPIPNQGWANSDMCHDEPTDDPSTRADDDPTVVVPVGIYDPPKSYKTFSGNRPIIRWENVWINDNDKDILVHVEDTVSDPSRYIEGSVMADYGRYWYDEETHTITWEGEIPGNGQVRIWYETEIPGYLWQAENQACAVWDMNGNGDWRDEASVSLSDVCSDDPGTPVHGDPTLWSDSGCNMSLGNIIWHDADKDSLYLPGTEIGIDGVKISLFWDNDASGDYSPLSDVFLASALSRTEDGEAGRYVFENLCPGDYIVRTDPSNFSLGALLYGYSGSDGAPDPDDDVNNDDNGEPLSEHGVVTKAVTLVSGQEPVDDGDTDPNTNLTADFGFYLPSLCPECPCSLSLGNIVWLDVNNDGIYQLGTDTGINGVILNLYADSDGSGDYTPGTDEFTGSSVTGVTDGESGRYIFRNLDQGDYIVQADPENFGAGGVLEGYSGLEGEPDPDNDINNDDNGYFAEGHDVASMTAVKNDNAYSADGYGVVSKTVTLRPGEEPVNDGDTDPDTNLTVDFGFRYQAGPVEPEPGEPECPPMKPF